MRFSDERYDGEGYIVKCEGVMDGMRRDTVVCAAQSAGYKGRRDGVKAKRV